MVNTPDETQRAFLVKYLGADLSDEGATANAAPLHLWQGAKTQIDGRIDALSTAMKGHGHPGYRALAEFGLGGVLDGQQTRLVAALMDFDRAPADQRAAAAAKVEAAVAGFRDFIGSRRVIDLLDQNPLGVPMNLRSTLEEAFDDIRTATRAAA